MPVQTRKYEWLGYLQTGLEMTVAVFIGFIGGLFADRLLGTGPWLLLLGSALGIAAGIWIAFQAVSRAGSELDKK